MLQRRGAAGAPTCHVWHQCQGDALGMGSLFLLDGPASTHPGQPMVCRAPPSKGLAHRHHRCVGHGQSRSPSGVREGSSGATFPHPRGDRLGQGGCARLKIPLETHLSAGVIWGTPSPSHDRFPCLANRLWAASGPCLPDKVALLMGDRANSPVQAGDSSCPLPRAGGRDCPPSPGGIHLFWGCAGNLTHRPCTCLQPARPPRALCAGCRAHRRITQGCSLPDRGWAELIPPQPSPGDGTLNV